MNIDAIYSSGKLGSELTVVNEPFRIVGKVCITLQGGEEIYWLYSDSGDMLSISPGEEETVLWRLLDDNIEPHSKTILYQGEEYEFTYEDSGRVTLAEGDAELNEEDPIGFSDYEAEDGALVRIVTNENTGNRFSLVGEIVVSEEIMAVD
jgi:hypothetical protein